MYSIYKTEVEKDFIFLSNICTVEHWRRRNLMPGFPLVQEKLHH